jgi:hypothetical protein
MGSKSDLNSKKDTCCYRESNIYIYAKFEFKYPRPLKIDKCRLTSALCWFDSIYNVCIYTRVYPKVCALSRESNEHLLRSNIKGYGGKTH